MQIHEEMAALQVQQDMLSQQQASLRARAVRLTTEMGGTPARQAALGSAGSRSIALLPPVRSLHRPSPQLGLQRT